VGRRLSGINVTTLWLTVYRSKC